MTTIATECPACPQGIVRCAHYDGRVVWLSDQLAGQRHDYGRHWDIRWGVLGPETPLQCVCSTDHLVMHTLDVLGTDSLPEAEAEFERRAELLRSEP